MPSVRAWAGIGGRDRLALPEHLPFRLPCHAVDDLHQRRLAGAVFAEHRVDLARHHREIDAVVGDDGRVDLADATQFEPRSTASCPGCAHCVPPWRCAPSPRGGAIRAWGGPARSCAAPPCRGSGGHRATAHLQAARRRPRWRSPRVPSRQYRRFRSGTSWPRGALAACPRASSRRSNCRRFETEPISPK